MTLDTLKEEYKKSITLEGDDLVQLTEEIDEAKTLADFVEVVGLWALSKKEKTPEQTILERILQVG